jgi:hypothetical protein
VRPSPEIDGRVVFEVARARDILKDLDSTDFLDSPYLVAAIYYHDGFLSDFPVDRTSADPERRIIGQIWKMLTAASKVRFVELLHEMWNLSGPPGPERMEAPLASWVFGRGRGHAFAIDLFAPEGSPVHSASRGIVVLADRGWSARDLFSTTSRKGGNSVIVFDPDNDRFYRYCHMDTVTVNRGQFLAAGGVIGTVGHTGWNAYQPGHGRHLHFEVNQYEGGTVRAMDRSRLRNMVLAFPKAAAPQPPVQATR